jgi:release factor glutamine methyltransferase
MSVMDFGGLAITYDARVLRPRDWTLNQSLWAVSLLEELPDGPVLELCAGAGQIGLAVAARCTRDLVCVDASRVATAYTAHNAAVAGLSHRVEIRQHRVGFAVAAEERFPLVIADPPWVRREETVRYPEDPLLAIDGGPDGLEIARECVAVIGRHLADGGAALLQLGAADQRDALEPSLEAAGLTAVETRVFGDRGIVVRLGR